MHCNISAALWKFYDKSAVIRFCFIDSRDILSPFRPQILIHLRHQLHYYPLRSALLLFALHLAGSSSAAFLSGFASASHRSGPRLHRFLQDGDTSGVLMPLSETKPHCPVPGFEAAVIHITLKFFRSRLFTPMIFAPAFSALATSSRHELPPVHPSQLFCQLPVCPEFLVIQDGQIRSTADAPNAFA